jgi:L,D-transpeptidase ErfK/SrfK
VRPINLFLSLALAATVAAESLPPIVGKNRTVSVLAGDSLYELGLRHGVAIEHFAFANNLPVQLAVPSSRELTVPQRRILPASPPENGLVVNLPERGVFLFRNGAFKLTSRVKDPTWMPPEWAGLGTDTVVPAGPDNPLGDRWLGLSMPGLGLHSTTQPASIGSAASHGCMRMYPSSVRELFEKVEVGDPVRIEYEPVKVGRDAETGSLSLVVFPDVYQSTSLSARADEVLAKAGLQNWVDSVQLERWLARPQGIPQVFAEGQVGLQLEGQDVAEPGLLLKTHQGLWISVEALRRLGVGSNYDGTAKAVTLTWKQATISYTMDEGVLLDGRLYLPARAPLQALGLAFHWDGPAKALVID